MILHFNSLCHEFINIGGKQPKSVKLSPGHNEDFSKADWELIKNDSYVKHLLESRVIQVVSNEDARLVDAVPDLTKMNVRDAEDFIKDASDVETLKQWLKRESQGPNRSTITKLIKHQLEALATMERGGGH